MLKNINDRTEKCVCVCFKLSFVELKNLNLHNIICQSYLNKAREKKSMSHKPHTMKLNSRSLKDPFINLTFLVFGRKSSSIFCLKLPLVPSQSYLN